ATFHRVYRLSATSVPPANPLPAISPHVPASTSSAARSASCWQLEARNWKLFRVLNHREEHLHESDGGRADRDDPDRRENAQHEREHHLDARLRGRFFGALTPFGPQRVRIDPPRLRDAARELVRR